MEIVVFNKGVAIVKAMSRRDFHQKVVAGIAQERAFRAAASFGIKNVTPKQKDEVKELLASIGISPPLMASEEAIDEIISAINSRAVSLQ